jgi:hypothetical protein
METANQFACFFPFQQQPCLWKSMCNVICGIEYFSIYLSIYLFMEAIKICDKYNEVHKLSRSRTDIFIYTS